MSILVPPNTNPYLADRCESCGRLADPDNGMRIRHKVTDEAPEIEEMQEWDGLCRATDGCEPVEPDGYCEHGHRSWMLAFGLI